MAMYFMAPVRLSLELLFRLTMSHIGQEDDTGCSYTQSGHGFGQNPAKVKISATQSSF